MTLRSSLLPLLAAFLVSSCGAGEAVRPKDPTFASASGRDASGGAICHDVKADGSPLIVDWRPEDRTDLEVAMKKKVAFVHYDCDSIKLLPDCHADGVYAFVGVTRQEQVIRLQNADEVKANLPFNGGSLGAKVGTGSSLEIGLVMIGKRSTTFSDITRDDMIGKCEGATHFVRAVTVGAFAMQTSTSGAVSSSAQLFGVGAGASSESSKGERIRNGDPDACSQSNPDAPSPPRECGALLRVQLVALGDKGGASGPMASLSCPPGLFAVDGKCAASADDLVKKCQAKDAAACAASCKASKVDSCTKWGDLMIEKALGEHSTAYDGPMAESFQRGCDLKNNELCAMLAINYAAGRGVPTDGPKAVELANRACQGGAAVGCTVLAGIYDKGKGVPVDRARGTRLYERACDAGDGTGCIAAAQAYGEGRPGVAVDRPKMVDYFDRACDAGEAFGCVNAGKATEAGDGVPASATTAMGFYRRGCQKKNQVACSSLKRLQGAGH